MNIETLVEKMSLKLKDLSSNIKKKELTSRIIPAVELPWTCLFFPWIPGFSIEIPWKCLENMDIVQDTWTRTDWTSMYNVHG